MRRKKKKKVIRTDFANRKKTNGNDKEVKSTDWRMYTLKERKRIVLLMVWQTIRGNLSF